MTWAFFLFKRRDIKLQIDTKVNVLGLAEVGLLSLGFSLVDMSPK